MMKKIAKHVILLLIGVVRLGYNYNTSKKISNARDILHTLWIKSLFRKFGNSSLIGKYITLEGAKYIEIGNGTTISRYGVLTCWDSYQGEKFNPSIIIGDNTSIGEYCHITSTNQISIGNGVLTGRRITITDNSHGEVTAEDLAIRPSIRKMRSKGPVIIEDNVWIGDKVSIMAGVKIGKGSIIAANAVVTKDIPPYSVAAGIPAKVIKTVAQ